MKLTKTNKSEIKRINAEAVREAKEIISANGSRLSLVAAFVYITASAGAGLVASYLLLNFLEYFNVALNDFSAYAIMFTFVFFFAAPAYAGMKHLVSAICDGREVSLSEMFIAFSSLELICASYLGALMVFLRYAVAALIVYLPEFIEDMIFESPEAIPAYFYPLALVIVLIVAAAWLIFTRRLTRISYFLWSRKMSFFKALAATVKQKYISRGIASAAIPNILLSVATCFILFIFHAGPLFAIEGELSMRRQEEYISNLKSEK